MVSVSQLAWWLLVASILLFLGDLSLQLVASLICFFGWREQATFVPDFKEAVYATGKLRHTILFHAAIIWRIALLPDQAPSELFSAREHKVSSWCRQLFSTLDSVPSIQSTWSTCRQIFMWCSYQNCRSGYKSQNSSLFRCAEKNM